MRAALLVGVLLIACGVEAQTRSVALTFDDLPAVNAKDAAEVRAINLALLDSLDRHHAAATAFVIGDSADWTAQSRPMLAEWRKRGYDIGNHTWSHASFNDLTVEQEETEILKGDQAIASLAGPGPRYLRFPYNATGDTAEKHGAILDFLQQHNYRVATCTIDNEDYVFAAVYAKALARHDDAGAAKIRAAYLDYTAVEIDFYAQLHKQLFGYEIPQVMLLHASRLNADTIDQVLDLFTARGYRFVSLAKAQSDAAYATPDTPATRYGIMWAYRWSKELGIKFTGPHETEPPDWINQYGK